MSLSSAQAAIIAKTAAISDVEFKASQITTQRLEYSQTTANIYQQLSNMDVPTPPQLADFNTIEYTFMQGTIPTTIGNVRPNGDRYNIEFIQQRVGNYMEGSGTVGVRSDGTSHYAQVASGDRQIYSLQYAIDHNFISSQGSNSELAHYLEGFRNANPDQENLTDAEIIASLCVYFDNVNPNGTPQNNSPIHFLDSNQVSLVTEESNVVYLDQSDCIPNGTYTASTTWQGCQLTFDSTNGRILTIRYPQNENGSGVLGRPVHLEANETTNETAYNAAFTEYEYEQHMYEQEQAKLNAQLEDIQYEDKKLEVELQGLQTQRSAMQKELESLQKVRDDGIESGFKGFA